MVGSAAYVAIAQMGDMGRSVGTRGAYGRRRLKALEDSFKGKTSISRPRAYIMAGPQGSGKSTKAKAILRDEKNFVYVNPDSTLMALNGGRRKLPDDNPEIFSDSQFLTEQILEHCITSKFNLCLDTSIPSSTLLSKMKRQGYEITFVVMTTPAELARKREVHRDLTQLHWGRAGEPLDPFVFKLFSRLDTDTMPLRVAHDC